MKNMKCQGIEFIAIETFFVQYCFMLLLYSPSSTGTYPSPLLLHFIFENANGLEKVLTNILKRFRSVNAILRLCYQSVTLQKRTHDLVTESSPSPC